MKTLLILALLPSLFAAGGERRLGIWELDVPLTIDTKHHSSLEVRLLTQYDASGTMTALGIFKTGGWIKSAYKIPGYCYALGNSGFACDFHPLSGITMLIYTDGQASMDIKFDGNSAKRKLQLTSPYSELYL